MISDVQLQVTTGDSRNKLGTTELRLGIVQGSGLWKMVDLPPPIIDRTKARLPASMAGANSSRMLGNWNTRDITMPDGQIFFVGYKVKTSLDIVPKIMAFGFKASKSAAFIELTFPVITDQHSSVSSLTLTGRFEPATAQEIRALPTNEHGLPSIPTQALDDLVGLYGDDVASSEAYFHEYWATLLRRSSDENTIPAFRVKLGRGNVDIEFRRLMPAIVARKKYAMKEVQKSKQSEQASTKPRVVIAKARRRVTIARRT